MYNVQFFNPRHNGESGQFLIDNLEERGLTKTIFLQKKKLFLNLKDIIFHK